MRRTKDQLIYQLRIENKKLKAVVKALRKTNCVEYNILCEAMK